MDPITLTTIGTVGTLAGVVIQLWSERSRVSRATLEQEGLRRLAAARREHTEEIRALRTALTRGGEASRVVSHAAGSLISSVREPIASRVGGRVARLEEEASAISAMGFDVVFEEVSGGYGLALPLSSEDSLVLWLPAGYPDVAPIALLWQPPEIQHIPFAPGGWDGSRYLAEVISALYPAFASVPREARGGSDATTTPEGPASATRDPVAD